MAPYATQKRVLETAKELVIGSEEPITIAEMLDHIDDADKLSQHQLEATKARANYCGLGSLVANLWETPDLDIDGDADQWRQDRIREYCLTFSVNN